MIVSSGLDVADLEFNPPEDFADLTDMADDNPGNGPDDFSLGVFHPDGGGATFMNAPSDIMAADGGNVDGEWVYNGQNEVFRLGRSGTPDGTPALDTVEIIAFLPGVTNTLCDRVNRELDLPTGVDRPAETGIDFAVQKTITGGTRIGLCEGGCDGTIGEDEAELDGQPAGCFSQGGINVYYHVLVER
jgi:hypothetical protein